MATDTDHPKVAFYGRCGTGEFIMWLAERPAFHARAATVKKVFQAFVALPGVRPSQPGAVDGMHIKFTPAEKVPPELDR